MTTTTDSEDGTLEIIDYTDGAYAYGTYYLDLYQWIPPEGVNTHYAWSAEVDGFLIGYGDFDLNFSSGGFFYYVARVYTAYAHEFVFHAPGGDTLGSPQDLTIQLGIGQIPVVWLRDPTTHSWHHAIPWVKTYDISVIDGSHIPIWKHGNPFVRTESGWVETTG